MVHPIDLTSKLLKRSLVFGSLSRDELRRLADEADVQWLQGGQVLWEWATLRSQVALVLEGAVETSRAHEGRRLLLETRERGDFIGFEAVAGEAYSADARATKTTQVALLPVEAIHGVIEANSDVALRIISEVATTASHMADQLTQAREPLAHRLWRLLVLLGGKDGTVNRTHADLAKAVGAERANVSRLLGRWEREERVRLGRGIITLTDASSVDARNVGPQQEEPDWIVLRETLEMTFADARCHASTIAHTDQGLVVSFFGGERPEQQDIWVMREESGRWTRPERVVSRALSTPARWNPVLHRGAGGTLHLFYKQGSSPSSWYGWQTRSETDGRTWAEPLPLPDGILGPIRNQPLALPDGSLLCPSSTELGTWQVHFERSTDDGTNWISTGPVADPEGLGAIQPSLIPWSASRLQALCRSRAGCVAQTWSTDGGVTWTPLKRTTLLNPNSAVETVLLPDGRAMLVYNSTVNERDEFHGRRNILSLAVSEDGTQWHDAGVLEKGDDEFSYPAATLDSNGVLHITYTAGRGWREIRHVAIDPSRL